MFNVPFTLCPICSSRITIGACPGVGTGRVLHRHDDQMSGARKDEMWEVLARQVDPAPVWLLRGLVYGGDPDNGLCEENVYHNLPAGIALPFLRLIFILVQTTKLLLVIMYHTALNNAKLYYYMILDFLFFFWTYSICNLY